MLATCQVARWARSLSRDAAAALPKGAKLHLPAVSCRLAKEKFVPIPRDATGVQQGSHVGANAPGAQAFSDLPL